MKRQACELRSLNNGFRNALEYGMVGKQHKTDGEFRRGSEFLKKDAGEACFVTVHRVALGSVENA